MKRDGACHSLWQDTTPEYDHKDHLIDPKKSFDVVIAGAGITGITTGLLLQKAGKSVLIAEAQTPGFGTTGGTTAHLNTMLETPYYRIEKNFGEEGAKLIAKATKQAIELIKRHITEYNIDCGFKDLPGYMFSQTEEQVEELEEIFHASVNAGIPCEWTDRIPVFIPFKTAIRFEGQATFHPTRYLGGLIKAFEEAGGVILNNCRVTKVDELESGHKVMTSRGDFSAANFIYATHIPPGVNLLHFRCAPYRSYAMAAKLDQQQAYPDALVYDLYDPYHYYRTQQIDGEYYFIGGGEDHKTGHDENTEERFRKLESHLRKYFPVKEIVNRWSSQFFEPTDGLPYIGHLPGSPGTMYVATGYSGNGMIYSAVAAMTLTDMISGNQSEYEELFDPNRIKMIAGFSNFVKEAADVVGQFVGKNFLPAEKLDELSDMAPGEAKVAVYEGQKMAIYKDENGKVHALNSACTHIKCEVAWNNAEKTWDCPCHGSRFSYTGEMVTAPARKDLTPVKIGKEHKV